MIVGNKPVITDRVESVTLEAIGFGKTWFSVILGSIVLRNVLIRAVLIYYLAVFNGYYYDVINR